MKMKKLLPLFLAIIAILISATTYAAAKPKETSAEKESKVNAEETYFKSFTGTVKEIENSVTAANTIKVFLESEEGSEAYLLLTEDTYYINDEEIRIGSVVTGYYDAKAMMIMIYPPQYVAEVVMVSNKASNIKVDLFDKELVSADNTLKLTINEDTKIVAKDGTVFKGELANRKLAVFYGASTRSIPAQTAPYKVVVLSEPLVPDEDCQSYYASFTGTVTGMEVSGKAEAITKVTLKDGDGREAIFSITKDTYRINDERITVGSVVTGYYDAKAFRIMIYPAQYEAEVIAVTRTEHNVKVDYFDINLTSADGTLKLNIGKDTEVIKRDGTEYHGKPVKTILAVIYDDVTKSIPTQTEPIKVVVLDDNRSADDKEENGDDNDEDGKDDIDDKDSQEDTDKKVEEWKKLSKEIFKNLNKIFRDMDDFYEYIRERISKWYSLYERTMD